MALDVIRADSKANFTIGATKYPAGAMVLNVKGMQQTPDIPVEVTPVKDSVKPITAGGAYDALLNKLIFVDLLTDLKAAPRIDKATYFMNGRTTFNDGLGGFYRFNMASTAAEEVTYLNVVAPNSGAGRWERVFVKARTIPQGVIVNNGGVLTAYINATTGANGEAAINVTEDNTATGKALFKEIWITSAQAAPATPPAIGRTGNTVMTADEKTRATDLKTLTYAFATGNSTTLGSTLLALVGLVIPGLKSAASGLKVTIKIEGV